MILEQVELNGRCKNKKMHFIESSNYDKEHASIKRTNIKHKTHQNTLVSKMGFIS